jgi:hypothetical protein
MLRSKPGWHIEYTPPWSGFLKIAAPRNRAFPWACMGCGVVLLYLDKVQVLASEYKRNEEVAPAPAAAAHEPAKS